MGNRLSGLWCKKTTTAIHINNDTKQQQQDQPDNNTRNSNNNNNNNKSNRRKTGGAAGGFGGTFRLGSARRLSLTSCVSRDKTEKKATTATNRELPPASSAISSIEQQYEKLHSQTLPRAKSAMKVDSAIPTVKVRENFNLIRDRADSRLLVGPVWRWRLNLQFVTLNAITCGRAGCRACGSARLANTL